MLYKGEIMVYLILETFDFEPFGKTYFKGKKDNLNEWTKEQIKNALSANLVEGLEKKKEKKSKIVPSKFDVIEIVEKEESEDGENSSS